MHTISIAEYEAELQWFTRVLDLRFRKYFPGDGEVEASAVEDLLTPDFNDATSPYAHLLRAHPVGFAERIALVMCLAQHLKPQLFDVFFTKNARFDRRFTEFGGTKENGVGFVPTGRTLLFILAGADLNKRLQALHLLKADHWLYTLRILDLDLPPQSTNREMGALRLTAGTQARLLMGQAYQPDFGIDFPARRLTTGLEWSDLILPKGTLKQLSEIKAWAKHGHTLLYDWNMQHMIRPGYRCLFYGPPGTGKTMTASLLGKTTGRPVYRIDLSLVVSKYIGETEKNLSRVFNQAEHQNWILFFDEADALFGKRTEVSDAHDRYANQEISFLLQRIESFHGIVILATNLKNNIDEAFARRFESMVYFPMPGKTERLHLWQQSLPEKATLAEDVNLEFLAKEFELSGGGIMNVVRYAALQALENGGVLRQRLFLEGVRGEMGK